MDMPMDLSDPRWAELDGSYGGTKDVLAGLKKAYIQGVDEKSLGDLINEVQHQGDTSTAMFAVAPHLIELALQADGRKRLSLLTHAGCIYADSTKVQAVECPRFLQDEFDSYAQRGAKALSPLLADTTDFDGLKWAMAGLAGFLNQHEFGRMLGKLDLYRGNFYIDGYEGILPTA